MRIADFILTPKSLKNVIMRGSQSGSLVGIQAKKIAALIERRYFSLAIIDSTTPVQTRLLQKSFLLIVRVKQCLIVNTTPFP
ncbi:MAG: hypothetical protein ACK4M7_03940, partial [Burkholderiales bacterium]